MYIVWTKDNYQELWARTDCDSLAAVEGIIRDNFMKEVEVEVTIPVSFKAAVTVKIDAPREEAPPRKPAPEPEPEVKEEPKSEAPESGSEEDKGSRDKGHKRVR